MRVFLILLVLSTLAFGCNKEKAINRNLKGDWEVTNQMTSWQNGYSNPPQSTEISNWAILSLDKNGEGTLDVFETQIEIEGELFTTEGFTLTAKHHVDGEERFEFFSEDSDLDGQFWPSDIFYVTWGWDKKSFQMSQRGMHYGDENQSYEVFLEIILSCKKK